MLHSDGFDFFTSRPLVAVEEHQSKRPRDETQARLIRIESRLCQLMLHVGLDPHTPVDRKETNHG